MTSMYAVEAKDRVKRLIIQPMQERGWKAPDGNLEFISACKKLGGYDQPIEADNEEQAAIKRTNKAFDYASEKLDGNNLRAYSEGFFVDARRYLVSEALKILRQNPDADLDITIPGEKISEWKQAASQRSTKGNINFEKVARKIA